MGLRPTDCDSVAFTGFATPAPNQRRTAEARRPRRENIVSMLTAHDDSPIARRLRHHSVAPGVKGTRATAGCALRRVEIPDSTFSVSRLAPGVGWAIPLRRSRCQRPEPSVTTTGPAVDAIKAWVEQCDAASTAGHYEQALELFTDDALFMPRNVAPLNVDAARSVWEGMFKDNTMQMTTRVAEVLVSGDLAVVRASYEETLTPVGGGEPAFMSGPWLITLKKQADGSWKGWHNMWEAVPPPSQ